MKGAELAFYKIKRKKKSRFPSTRRERDGKAKSAVSVRDNELEGATTRKKIKRQIFLFVSLLATAPPPPQELRAKGRK